MTYIPYATVNTPGDGSTDVFAVPFPFLHRQHVHVWVGPDDNGEAPEAAFTWLSDGEIQLAEPPEPDVIVKIKRITPLDDLTVVFTVPDTIEHTHLNLDFYQLLYALQEMRDDVEEVKALAAELRELLELTQQQFDQILLIVESMNSLYSQMENLLGEMLQIRDEVSAALDLLNAIIAGAQPNAIIARVGSVADVTLPTGLLPGAFIDGIELAGGDLVMLKDQTDPSENGLWAVSAVPQRHPQFDEWQELQGVVVSVSLGTVNEQSLWLGVVEDEAVIGTDPVNFVPTSITPTHLSSHRDSSNYYIESSTGVGTGLLPATPLLAGVMTSTDKVKLDSIEFGAEENPTPGEIVGIINQYLGGTGWQASGGGSSGGGSGPGQAWGFYARTSGTQSVPGTRSASGDIRHTNITLNSDNRYNSGNGRWRPGVAGAVVLYVDLRQASLPAGASSRIDAEIRKNGNRLCTIANGTGCVIDYANSSAYYTVRMIYTRLSGLPQTPVVPSGATFAGFALGGAGVPSDVVRLNTEGQGPAQGGVRHAVKSLGSRGSGTLAVDVSARGYQTVVNTGTFALDLNSANGSCILIIENSATAGNVNLGNLNVLPGSDPIDTDNNSAFRVALERVGPYKNAHVLKLR